MGSNGKVYNAETGNRVYIVPMLAQMIFRKAGKAKFQAYLLAKNVAPKASVKKEPTLLLLAEKGSEKSHTPKEIWDMLNNIGILPIGTTQLPRIVELMDYSGELKNYSVTKYVDGMPIENDAILLQVMVKLNHYQGNTFSLLDKVIRNAINGKESSAERGEEIQKGILLALEGYPAIAEYAANAFKTGCDNYDARRAAPTNESYFFTTGEKDKLAAAIDGFVARGLMVRDPESGRLENVDDGKVHGGF